MAARKFPRDRRQWFRLTCDILEDPKVEQLTGDEFRLFVNILAALARAGSRDGSIALGPRALRSLACKQQTRHAEPLLSRLDDVGLTSSRRGADVTLTTVCNWAKIQGFDCTNRVEESRVEKREPIRTGPPLRGVHSSKDSPLTPEDSPGNHSDPPGHLSEKHPSFSDTTPTGESVHTPAVQTPPKKPKSEPPSARALELSQLLRDRLFGIPGARFPRGWHNRWARTLEQMPAEIPELQAMDTAVRSNQIARSINWVLGKENLASEYKIVVHSAKALREKWPQIQAAMTRKPSSGGKAPAQPTPPIVTAGPRPIPPTTEQIAESQAIGDERRSKDWRARHAEAPTAAPPTDSDDEAA